MTTPADAQYVGPPALPVFAGTIAASVQVNPGDQVVTGWSVKESTGAAAAEVWLLDGNDANGDPFAFITLSPGQSVRDATAVNGILCQRGVFARMLAGSVTLSVWVIDL